MCIIGTIGNDMQIIKAKLNLEIEKLWTECANNNYWQQKMFYYDEYQESGHHTISTV